MPTCFFLQPDWDFIRVCLDTHTYSLTPNHRHADTHTLQYQEMRDDKSRTQQQSFLQRFVRRAELNEEGEARHLRKAFEFRREQQQGRRRSNRAGAHNEETKTVGQIEGAKRTGRRADYNSRV